MNRRSESQYARVSEAGRHAILSEYDPKQSNKQKPAAPVNKVRTTDLSMIRMWINEEELDDNGSSRCRHHTR